MPAQGLVLRDRGSTMRANGLEALRRAARPLQRLMSSWVEPAWQPGRVEGALRLLIP